MKETYVLSVLVVAAVAVLVWGLFSFSSPTAIGSPTYQYYESQAQAAGSPCGSLTDPSNVQHLSHHPNQYAACIKQVDPAVFQQAVGQSKEAFMQANGIA